MPSYTAPVEDMLFLFDKLRDNKNYNELKKYDEVTIDLVKDILDEAAKINQNLILPLAKIGDENPAVLENGVVEHPQVIKRLTKNILKMAGHHYLVIQNLVVRVCQKQLVHFLMKCFRQQAYLLNYIVN
jgi:hypothetical protein